MNRQQKPKTSKQYIEAVKECTLFVYMTRRPLIVYKVSKMDQISYFHKPRSNPLEYHTLHQIIDKHAANNPGKECIVFYDTNQQRTSLTYQQLKDQSIKFAASLLKLGFKRGDRILLYTANSLQFMVCWMALTRIGILAILMRSDVQWKDLTSLKRFKCAGVITGLKNIPDKQRQRIEDEIAEVIKQKDEHGHLYTKAIITIGEFKININHPNILRYENLIDVDSNQPDVKQAESKVDPEDAAFVCFTSGSTGAPKGVVYTHFTALNSVNILIPGMPAKSDRKSFAARPIGGSSRAFAILYTLFTGSTHIITLHSQLTMKDSYKFMFDIIIAENCSGCSIPQEHVVQLLDENIQENYDFAKVTAWGFGSEIVHRKTVKALLDAFPTKPAIVVYATSEVLTVGIQPLSKATIDKKEDFGKVYMFPDIEVKVIDDNGLVVPLGTKGEICVRGPKMFLEYLEDPAATTAAKKPTGWVHTGDYGIMYDRARLKVLGRKVDLIVAKDQAFFPIEVEEVLLENSDVQDVIVVGVPNKDYKHDVCACIIEVPGSNLKKRVSELHEWCEKEFNVVNNNQSPMKPKHFLFMKEFPISISAKVDRQELRNFANKTIIS